MKKYENFCLALENLKDIYNYEEPYSNVVLTGLTVLYGICFEQSWKAVKEILEDSGFVKEKIGSPKQILKTAYQAGIIEDEAIWLEALTARNNVAHAYNRAVALDIINETKTKYYTMFCRLKDNLENDWIS